MVACGRWSLVADFALGLCSLGAGLANPCNPPNPAQKELWQLLAWESPPTAAGLGLSKQGHASHKFLLASAHTGCVLGHWSRLCVGTLELCFTRTWPTLQANRELLVTVKYSGISCFNQNQCIPWEAGTAPMMSLTLPSFPCNLNNFMKNGGHLKSSEAI